MIAPSPPPRRCRWWIAGCSSRWLHTPACIIWWLAKAAAIFVFLAWAVGLPGGFVSKKTATALAPWQLECTRMTWNPLRGFVLHNVQVSHAEPLLYPSAQADALIAKPDFASMAAGRWQWSALEIENGKLHVPLLDATSGEWHETIAITGLQASATAVGTLWHITALAQSDVGTRFAIAGSVANLDASIPPSPGDGEPARRSIATIPVTAPPWLANLRKHLHEVDTRHAPEGSLTMNWDFAQPEDGFIAFTWQVPAFAYRGSSFSGAQIDLRYEDGIVHVRRVELRADAHRLLVEGTYAIHADRFEARAYADLTPQQAFHFFPWNWREQIKNIGFSGEGRVHAEGWIGPSTLAAATTQWGGWISLEEARIDETPVEKAFASFKREPNTLLVQDGQVTGGGGPGRGTIGFQFKVDSARNRVTGNFDAAFELAQIAPSLPSGLRTVAQMFEVPVQPPRFIGNFSCPLDDLDGLMVQGWIRGDSLSFRTVPVVRAETHLIYSNNIVILDPFNVTCATGGITGSLHLDLTEELYQIDLDVTTNPQSVAPMAGTNLVRHLAPYRFSDDILVRVNGRVDAAEDAVTDLHVQVSGRHIGWGRAGFDRVQARAHRTPGMLAITNIAGSFSDGTVTGQVFITLNDDADDTFTLEAYASDLSFDRVAALLAGSSTNGYEGRVHASARVQGMFPDAPDWKRLTGDGTIRIENARLLSIPVFGGLSRLLSGIYPGLGFSEQNRAEGTVMFGGGHIRTDDLKINGNLITLAAKGSYTWDHRLDFDVLVHPFRDGSLASAVRVITIPISMLLEYNLSGPTTNLRWRAVNSPL